MPNSTKIYLAADLGASSGRVVAGNFSGQNLTLEEIHRFENGGVLANDTMHWDLLNQWSQVKQGLHHRLGEVCQPNRLRRRRHLGC